jgi:ADP-heptose:LPS heptosyltransferase
MLPDVSRILLVRTDKIGDVTLTTPAIAALRKQLPNAVLVGLTSPFGAEIYRGNPHLNETIEITSEHAGFFGFFRLLFEIRRHRFDAVVIFQTRFTIAFVLWLSRIRYRIGPLSKWWSWIFYNRGRRQNRSAVEMHEAEYNIQLLRSFDITVADTKERTYLQVQPEAKRSAAKFFAEKGLSNGKKTVAIHPGMAGSALNWPENHYGHLGRSLSKRYNVLVTGGLSEVALVERVFQDIAKSQTYMLDQPMVAKYVGERGLAELIAILDRCDGVVAPSTGPMHLAVALGKKVVSVFSPIKVQSAVRWGPYGVNMGTNLGILPADQVSVLVPDVNCAEGFRCALSACIYYPCMPRIAVEDVETQLLVLLEGSSVSMVKSGAFVAYELEDEGESGL